MNRKTTGPSIDMGRNGVCPVIVRQRDCRSEAAALSARGVLMQDKADSEQLTIEVNCFGITIFGDDGAVVDYLRFRTLCQAPAARLKQVFAQHGIKVRRTVKRLGHSVNTVTLTGIRGRIKLRKKHGGPSSTTRDIYARQLKTGSSYWSVHPLD